MYYYCTPNVEPSAHQWRLIWKPTTTPLLRHGKFFSSYIINTFFICQIKPIKSTAFFHIEIVVILNSTTIINLVWNGWQSLILQLQHHKKLALKECSVVAVKTGFVIETNSTKHNSNILKYKQLKCNNYNLK